MKTTDTIIPRVKTKKQIERFKTLRDKGLSYWAIAQKTKTNQDVVRSYLDPKFHRALKKIKMQRYKMSKIKKEVSKLTYSR